MSEMLRRRRGAARFAGVLVASAVVSGGVFASSTAAQADEQIPVTVPTFAADDFIELAAQLPATLREAIERDLGVAPEQYLANAERARAASDAATLLRNQGVDVLGASIDGQDVTINVASDSDAAAVEASGARVVVGPLEALNTDREVQPARDHKGGYGYAYQVSEPDETGAFQLSRCSVGFSGYDPDGNSRYLTAGHCGIDEATGEQFTYPVHHIELDAPIWGTEDWASEFPGPDLGEFVPGSFHFGGEHDGGLVDITNPEWTAVPQVAGWAGGAGAPDDASVTIRGPIDAVAGAQACKSGATSGWTCGDILVPVQSTPVGEQAVTGFIFNACMLGGDSGGSVVVGNYALGVNSGSTHDGRTECDSWNPAQSPDSDGDFSIGYSLATGQYNALTLLGGEWELSVAVATPVVTSPEDGGETGPRPTFTGTVEGARSTHEVRVVIDGDDAYEGRINDDGTFSVAIDELVPGEHTYEVTASYGNFSRSAVAEGTFTSTEVQAEPLTVASPTDGQTTGNARPSFTGTGQPGATVTLTVGDEVYGEATVGDDGSWTIAPSADLPVGERFDATVTQEFEGDVQSVTVADLGITVPAVTIAEPEDGATVTGDVVFSGTVYPAAELTLAIEGTVTESSERVQTAADEWAGELEIGEDGSWTFTPAEALENGEYTLTASAAVEGGDPELTASETSVSFTVADDGEELPDTGSSNVWMIVVGVALLALGGVAIAIRARRNGTTA